MFVVITMALSSCQDMEETYEDYVGDGPKRYVGKIKDLEVEPGWERFKIKWKNSNDATIEKIKIVISYDKELKEVLLDKDIEEYTTKPVFGNQTYEIAVYAIDKNGQQSIKSNYYCRPFTNQHEMLAGFAHVESKYFYIDNNLVLFLAPYNNKIQEQIIKYWQNGEQKELVITKDICTEKYQIIKNIDLNKKVIVERKAIIDECFDELSLATYSLDKNVVNMSSDFKKAVKISELQEEITDTWIKSTTELHLDYDITSLEDVLYFSNLKKVILGANRFLSNDHLTSNLSVLKEKNNSIYALKLIQELKEVKVVVYNNQYNIANQLISAKTEVMTTLPFPALNVFDTSKWTIKSNDKEEDKDQLHPVEHLIDNKKETDWMPLPVQEKMRSHEIIIDMQEEKTIKGFVARQSKNVTSQNYFADKLHIMISKNEGIWQEALDNNLRSIGKGIGETTIIKLRKEKRARYIKLIVHDRFSQRKNVCLSDFVIF